MMIASKFLICSAVAASALLASSLAQAQANLDAHSQTKVSNAMAKKWNTADTSKDGYQAQQSNTLVNIGSKKGGNCSLNVGTTQKGQKAPKDVIVTTKDVINICK
jgi:hypothetical protein